MNDFFKVKHPLQSNLNYFQDVIIGLYNFVILSFLQLAPTIEFAFCSGWHLAVHMQDTPLYICIIIARE
jgi:hypothetical protein